MATTKSNQPNTTSKMTATAKTNASAVKTGTMKPTPSKAPTTNQTTGNNKTVSSKPVNPKTEAAQDMTKLDDVAIISDVLSNQKNLIKLYGNALCEVSCEKLRKLVGTQLTECGCDQFDAFLYMNQRNLYPTEPAPTQKMTQAKQKFAQAKQKMK